jgi:hypothetical protein
MPTVLRWKGHASAFQQRGQRATYIHIDKDGSTVKYRLDPVRLARRIGFTDGELRLLEEKVRSERGKFIEAWNEYFGNCD